jgi:inosine-uridine nucleoside N-ribohydrolase
MKVIPVLALVAAAAWASPKTLIVDTDAGTDDLMAIAFLLSRSDVHIEAITVVNGLAHVQAGAKNILRLLELAGSNDIPVYIGHAAPLAGKNSFPDSWRRSADEPPSVDLPTTKRTPEPHTATEYLVKRLAVFTSPVSILALGPLSNIADALEKFPRGIHCVEDMAIMGGAVRVRGNLGDGGYYLTDNNFAEWNLYVDPLAAKKVFESGVRFRLIPLDATNQVPIDAAYLNMFKTRVKTPLGKFAARVLESSRTLIANHIFYAWDPLAAVSMVVPEVVKMSSVFVEVQTEGTEQGRLIETQGKAGNARVALEADAALFQKTFLEAFGAASVIEFKRERRN